MTTANTNTTNQTNVQNLLQEAQKHAFCAVRTAYRGGGNNDLYILQNAIRRNDKKNQLAQDLIQTSRLALIEYKDLQEDLKIKKVYSELHKEIYNSKGIRGNWRQLCIDDPVTGQIIDVKQDIRNILNGIISHEMLTNIISLLTPTQKKVLQLMAYGHTNITIAKKLNISTRRVSQHIQAITEKAFALYPDGCKNLID